MAPMEPAKADDGLSREELEKALAGCGLEELQEMRKRLSKSSEQFQEMLDDLKAEQNALRDEKEHLNDTISMMMKEMQKLNIGSDNTVEPQLQEGPLDFVGRFWEKVKPRNSAYAVNEHVGEIKKPGEDQENQPLQQIQEQGKQVAQKLASKLGPLWQRAEGLVQQGKDQIAKQMAERARQQEKEQRKQEKKARKRAEKIASTGDVPAASSGAGDPEAASSTAAASSEAPAPPPVPRPAPPAAAPEATPAAPAAAPAAAPPAPAAAPAPEPKPAEEAKAAEPADEPGEEEVASTTLIEASLKIDDGSTHTLFVRAADRPKEVSKRFVQEHSLKAWFEEPLTAWLKKVEADADVFPVKVEADLMEIRKQHSKSK